MRSFKPDVRRTRLEPVDSAGAFVFLVVFVVDAGLGTVFFSSTSRPRCFVGGGGGIFERDVSLGLASA